MGNSTVNLEINRVGKGGRKLHIPVDGGAHIRRGTLVSLLAATAMAVPGSTALSTHAKGVALNEVDNTSGSDGDKRVEIEYGDIFEFPTAGGADEITEATELFSVIYMYDDHTLADNDGSGSRKAAGRFAGMSANGKVRVFVGLVDVGDTLASAVNVPITDAGLFTSTTDVEAALQELYQNLFTTQASIPFSLHSLREVDANGDVGNIAANGGLLASDTTPILRADAAESEEVSWAATNVDAVQLQTTLPNDLDDTADVTVDLYVYTDNAGGGGIDAAAFTVESSWDGAAKVSDAAADGSPATSVHKITATIDKGDIPSGAARVTLTLIPNAHGNDPIQLVAARLNYKRKLLTS